MPTVQIGTIPIITMTPSHWTKWTLFSHNIDCWTKIFRFILPVSFCYWIPTLILQFIIIICRRNPSSDLVIKAARLNLGRARYGLFDYFEPLLCFLPQLVFDVVQVRQKFNIGFSPVVFLVMIEPLLDLVYLIPNIILDIVKSLALFAQVIAIIRDASTFRSGRCRSITIFSCAPASADPIDFCK